MTGSLLAAWPAPPSLNRHLPLWYQVAHHLLMAIRGRAPEASLRLPTEAELARHYGVSLITVREALRWLEAEGMISRQRRRGTFVNPDVPAGRTLMLSGSLQTVFDQQQATEVDVLDQSVTPVPAGLAARFPDQAEVMAFRRLRRHEGTPVSRAVNYLPLEIGRRVPVDMLRHWPMTRVLQEALGLPIARIEDTVQAQLATPELCPLLDIPLLSPVLFFTGVTLDAAGSTLDLAQIHYRGDRFRFSVSFDVPATAPEQKGGPR
ncbi:GntR family transcriptional regulator [Roseomonas populi]|uniref:GntR family transcriptional regulator n=1 Tax=Roseomonas populi TaxID=3121582 RepID=A0ABT1X3W0_9PROT|nr:GntR family transcriptional regulator [Roseomonas pecuniae]MCR0982783.1 GntR family transcriptional regulator [Roseomonas pecuniae]